MELLELDNFLDNFSDDRLVYDNHQGKILVGNDVYNVDADIDVRFVEVVNHLMVGSFDEITEYTYEVKQVHIIINEVFDDNDNEITLTNKQYCILEQLIIEEVENVYQ